MLNCVGNAIGAAPSSSTMKSEEWLSSESSSKRLSYSLCGLASLNGASLSLLSELLSSSESSEDVISI